MKLKNIKMNDMIFITLLLCVIVFYLWKVHYGIGSDDESFYITLPYRLVVGDSLLSQEWHLSQLFGFIMYPIVYIYSIFNPNFIGAIVDFRYIYILFQIIIAVLSYLLLRKQYGYIAMFISILFALYSPFGIMALSYNSLSVACVFLITVLMIGENSKNKLASFFIGILMAFLVLINPYLIMLFILYIGLVFTTYCNKSIQWDISILSIQSLMYILLGIIVITCLFILFVLSRASISEILENLAFIFKDPSHPAKSISLYMKPIIDFAFNYKVCVILVLFIYLIGFFVNKKVQQIFVFLIILLSCYQTLYLAIFDYNYIGMNAFMLPFFFVGFAIYSYTRLNHKVFFCMWIFGLFYGLCMNATSSQGMYVISMGLSVSSFASIILLYEYCKNIDYNIYRKRLNFSLLITTLVFLTHIGAQSIIKINHTYSEESVDKLNTTITTGVLKGVRTTKTKADDYYMFLRDIKKIENRIKNSSVLFYKNIPLAYLETKCFFGTYSAWNRNSEDLTSYQFYHYYQLHPENIPDFIYIDSVTFSDLGWSYILDYCNKNNYTFERLPSQAYILSRRE